LNYKIVINYFIINIYIIDKIERLINNDDHDNDSGDYDTYGEVRSLIIKFKKLEKLYQKWGDYPCCCVKYRVSSYYECLLCAYYNIDYYQLKKHTNSSHKDYQLKKEINKNMLDYLLTNKKDMTIELCKILQGIDDYTDIPTIESIYIKLKNTPNKYNTNKPFKLY